MLDNHLVKCHGERKYKSIPQYKIQNLKCKDSQYNLVKYKTQNATKNPDSIKLFDICKA